MPQTIDAGAEGRAVVNLNRFDLAMLKPFMPETTQASGIFTGKADVAWDTTKEGLPQGSITLSGRNVQVTQTVNDAALPVAFQTLNLTAELRNNRAELGWTIRLTNNGQFDGQVQVTDPQGRRNLGGNVNIRNFNLAMINPIFNRGEKAAGMVSANWHHRCVWVVMCKARSCLVSFRLRVWISTATLCRLICSRASLRSTLTVCARRLPVQYGPSRVKST
ncbi:hypothetical protein EIMP300_86970 [Escherichia coli]|uniref:Translocation and assembly module for autotransporter export, inner membrane subunit n=1 Tax=Escherichia coli TaxID=562 RepID=A0A8S0G519_ECOLX|nr:hypothetical protein EIMP300_86970 [Escherichia coli]